MSTGSIEETQNNNLNTNSSPNPNPNPSPSPNPSFNPGHIEETWERIIHAEIFRGLLEKICAAPSAINGINVIHERTAGEKYVQFINHNFAAKKKLLPEN